jgi:hypothetical protein
MTEKDWTFVFEGVGGAQAQVPSIYGPSGDEPWT